ncbi:MAG: nucleotidyltransferase family protein [Clostridia bacterium]|nr:nucleotidyltransferase family protein [Clostridia bacterium]
MKKTKVGCVLMAAGNSSRFGKNKLMTDFQGRSLILRALDAIPEAELAKVVVVSQYGEVLEYAKKYGYTPILNDAPNEGVSRTIKLGLKEMEDMDGVMFMVADQPCLKQSSVNGLIGFFRRNRASITAMGFGTRRGNPAIFPRKCFDDLMLLEGDMGGSLVICRHEKLLKLYQVESELELFDADSAKELERLSELVTQQ